MDLSEIRVTRTPGIETAYDLKPFEPGINLILGPNGSGKSSTRRALAGTLFPEANDTAGFEVDVVVVDARGKTTARLRSRSVEWERADGSEDGRPALPSPLRASCYAVGVRDLLDDSGGSEDELARAVRTQMAGGYDVEALVADGGPFRIKKREGNPQTEALEKARAAQRALALELEGLAQDEDRLAKLKTEAEEAKAAVAELRRLEAAAELKSARVSEAECTAKFESFPKGLAAASAGDAKLEAQLRTELDELGQRIAAAEGQAAEAAAELAAGGDALDSLDREELERRESELERLRDRERGIEAARANLEQCEAALAVARTESGAEEHAAMPTPADLRELEHQLAATQKLDAELSQVEARARDLSSRAELTALGDARGGIEDLRSWLRTPTAEDLRIPNYLYSGGGLAVVAGLVGGFLLHPLVFAVTGVGAGFLTTHIMLGQERRLLMMQRTSIESRFNNRPQLDKLNRWTVSGVSQHLDVLEAEVTQAAVATQARTELESVTAKRKELRAQRVELEIRATELSDRLGFDPNSTPLERSELARRLASVSDARRDVERARAALETLLREKSELQAALSGFLEVLGFQPGDSTGAVAEAIRAALKRAAGAAAQRTDARAKSTAATTQLPGLLARRDELAKQQGEFFAERQLSPGDRAGLQRLLDQLGPFAEARDALAAAKREHARLEATLQGQLELADLEAADLDARIQRATELSSSLDALNNEIGRITQRFETESGRDRMQDAEHTVERAEADLAGNAESLFERAAAGFLLGDTAAEFERTSRPDVLARAGELFAEFTAHRYDLMVQSEDGGGTATFKAKETERGRELGLAQLSDGTRMQLLLAVRIAFAEEAERSEKMPLVLDEAFSMSDNERWAEMVRSLYSLAAAGRQVIYFSANENEIESWCNLAEESGLPQPNSLDLAAARKLEGHERQVTLIPRRSKQIPKVAGLSPEEAMEVLQVPLPQPHKSVEEMHLLHLLNEDLEILDVCLESKVTTVGQWRSAFKRRRGAKLAGDHAKAGRIDSRTRVAERTVQAWHAGRNRPVGRAELEEAGVTPKWLDEVSGLLAEMGGDPGRLVEALRDKAIKGYQRPKTDKHEAWFQAEGFMDGDTILDEDEIAERAVAAAAKDMAAGRITEDEARLLSLEISGLLDEAGQALELAQQS